MTSNPNISNTETSFALDSAIPKKKIFYRDLVASLRNIAEIEEKAAKTGKHRSLSRGGVRAKRVVEVRTPMGVTRIMERTMKPQEVREMIRDNCSLIKTVDKDLVPGIERRLKRIYEKRKVGQTTPSTLQRYLERECDLEDWQAKRIVDDQMNKIDARANLERLKKQGVKTVRWVHGNCHEPRPYHLTKWDGHSGLKDGHPNGLNGFVFSLDGPLPIIDEKRMTRGLPGDAILCHCRLEAVE